MAAARDYVYLPGCVARYPALASYRSTDRGRYVMADSEPRANIPAVIRKAIADGRLPRLKVTTVCAGSGSDRHCDDCHRPVRPSETEHEIDASQSRAGGGDTTGTAADAVGSPANDPRHPALNFRSDHCLWIVMFPPTTG